MNQMQTTETLARGLAMTIKQEIRESAVLMSCTNFAELHDHCDANCLGGQEAIYDGYGMEGHEIVSRAQDIVDSWLKDLAALRED